MVDNYVPGVETILGPNEYWILASDTELVSAIERVLEFDDDYLRKIRMNGAKHIFNHHRQAHRVASLLENVRCLRVIRDTGTKQMPYLHYFLPEVYIQLEQQRATLNWPGV